MMTSERKRIANSQNARRSTGPRTPEGKRIASQNAVTHGLLSREVLLPDEGASALNELRTELTAELAPVGALEAMHLDIIVTTLWKWRRLNRLEQDIFVYHQNSESYFRQLSPGLRQLTVREQLALVLVRDAATGDKLGKLARYEVMLERRLVRSLHELERLQAARQGIAVLPPVAVDITVTESDSAQSGSGSERAAADIPPATREEAADPQRAQTGTETPSPTVVEAVDAPALPSEPGVPMDPGTPADPARNEPTEIHGSPCGTLIDGGEHPGSDAGDGDSRDADEEDREEDE